MIKMITIQGPIIRSDNALDILENTSFEKFQSNILKTALDISIQKSFCAIQQNNLEDNMIIMTISDSIMYLNLIEGLNVK